MRRNSNRIVKHVSSKHNIQTIGVYKQSVYIGSVYIHKLCTRPLPLTGMSRHQTSPPSLQLSWMAIFVATDINICFFDRVLWTTHWLGTIRKWTIDFNVSHTQNSLQQSNVIYTHNSLQTVHFYITYRTNIQDRNGQNSPKMKSIFPGNMHAYTLCPKYLPSFSKFCAVV